VKNFIDEVKIKVKAGSQKVALQVEMVGKVEI